MTRSPELLFYRHLVAEFISLGVGMSSRKFSFMHGKYTN